MTPRMSNIGASIRKMFSGIGGGGDYYWDNTVLALRGEQDGCSLEQERPCDAHEP